MWKGWMMIKHFFFPHQIIQCETVVLSEELTKFKGFCMRIIVNNDKIKEIWAFKND